MSTPRMIRCINGHVFDVSVDQACPVCGWAPPEKTDVGKGNTGNGDSTPRSVTRRAIIIAAGTAAVAGGGLYAVLGQKPQPSEPPKKLTSSGDTARQTKVAERDANDAPPFENLKPLQPSAQIAAATTLKLSPFATETTLLTRAKLLAQKQPSQLKPKRLLVDFVKANQPLALAEIGAACYFGYGVKTSDQLALDYATRAANQGAVRGRTLLAQMLLAGRGVPRDPKTAGDLLVLAARADSAGSAQAVTLLRALSRSLDGTGPNTIDLAQALSAQNWQLATKLAQSLADVQIAAGYTVLGQRYWQGIGVNKDPAAALGLWKKAVAIGYPNASYELSRTGNASEAGSSNVAESMIWLVIAFLQSEDKARALFFTDKISSQSGLLDGSQWAAIRTLFVGLAFPGPK